MKLRTLKDWLNFACKALEYFALASPIIWAPIFFYRRQYETAYMCVMLFLSIIVCCLVERRADSWQKIAEYWKQEAEQWRLFDARINALEEGQSMTITKGGDKAKNYRVM